MAWWGYLAFCIKKGGERGSNSTDSVKEADSSLE